MKNEEQPALFDFGAPTENTGQSSAPVQNEQKLDDFFGGFQNQNNTQANNQEFDSYFDPFATGNETQN